ncbi:MAG TPA: hypothetical protein VFB08_19110 [Burkholderiales bacterium]|nr:hypothetical protein [Burkholderiales bacterium]
MNAIFLPFEASDKHSVSIDAKQRVVVAGVRNGWTDINPDTNIKTVIDPQTVICAEPSPDALSVLGATFGGSASGSAQDAQQLALKLALATNESGSNIGLRTQTITILRDAMFRLCEGYMDGALSANAFERLQRRYQNIMLALLSIEQLTGAVTPKPTNLSSTTPPAASLDGNGGSNGNKPNVTQNPKPNAQAPGSSASGASTPESTQPAKVTAAPQAGDPQTNPQAPDPKTNPKQSDQGSNRPVTDTLGSKVADTVVTIVNKIIDVDYTLETCLNYMLDNSKASASQTAVEFCEKSLKLGSTRLEKAIEKNAKP